MKRPPGFGTVRSPVLGLLLLTGLAAGCGDVVVGATLGSPVVASPAVADLRVEGPVTITVDASGGQTVQGTVVNTGSLVADGVQVVLTLFVADAFGRPFAFETVPGIPVFDTVHGTRTLFPGERGTFAVFLPARPPIVDVDVQIEALFRPDGQFVFFIVTPGIVIIIGG